MVHTEKVETPTEYTKFCYHKNYNITIIQLQHMLNDVVYLSAVPTMVNKGLRTMKCVFLPHIDLELCWRTASDTALENHKRLRFVLTASLL